MSEAIAATLQAWPWPVDKAELTPEQLVQALRQQFDSHDLAQVEVRFEAEPRGCHILEWEGEWNYGLVGNCEDLLAVFREHGIAYVVNDSAKYEFEAEIRWWHPGMEQESHEQGSNDGGPVLTAARFNEIVAQAMYDREVAEAVRAFFSVEPWSWKPEAAS